MSVTEQVRARYSAGAQNVQPDLCCPVDYDRDLLKILPAEIIERDYGCGDPSRHVQPGDHVLDLGSGGGKICYMAAQLVGPEGRVTGVDMNEDMLALARRYQGEMATRIGSDRVRFHKGYIQDLALDLETVESWLTENRIDDLADLRRFESWQKEQRTQRPMIADESIDLVISNCVLNLVEEGQRRQMIAEIFRVLRPGGRVAISDIVAHADVPTELKADHELWTGCISGAFQEHAFLQAFADAGFVALAYDSWQAEPWRVVAGIEFRSVTLTAVKPSGEECWDSGQAAIYVGPYREVHDDEGHVFPRGRRMAVCERTFRFLRDGPLRADFVLVDSPQGAEKQPFCAPPGTERPATETRSGALSGSAASGGCC